MIYLDNAGTTKVDQEVLNSMLPFFCDIYGNASSLHTMGQVAKEKLEEARLNIANCIGASADEIYFTSGGSESDNWAISTACKFGAFKGKKHIITSQIEHHAVLHLLDEYKRQGFSVTYLPVYEKGIVRVEDLVSAIREDTCLVTIMFANNEIGTLQPIEEIGKICQQKNIIFHTDGVQAVGHVKIDVKDLAVNMMSFSAHKFHGPKGVGGLYVKKHTPLFNLIYGGAQEANKRAGTENLAGIIGMARALEIATNQMDEVAKKEIALRDRLFEELSKIPHSKINGDVNLRLSNNFNMCFEGIEGESLLLMLDGYGICASSGSACTSGSLDPSHVLLALGLPHEVAHGSLRLTLSKYNTEEEITECIQAVKNIVEVLRKMSPVWDELQKGERSHVI